MWPTPDRDQGKHGRPDRSDDAGYLPYPGGAYGNRQPAADSHSRSNSDGHRHPNRLADANGRPAHSDGRADL